jgi:predicted fused transcriptional regulator/phosphomethylpyrimidine kinase/predicted transcriptional regulator
LLIQEAAAKKIIPPLKGILIHRLRQRGLSQRKIAGFFGISQPQIHKYLKTNVDYYYDLLSLYGYSRDEIQGLTDLLVEIALKNDKARFTLVASSIVEKLTLRYLCSSMDYLKNYCSSEKEIVDPYIEQYRLFVARVLSIRGIHRLIPEVGMNIAYMPEPSQSISGVIGIPGRIIRVGFKAIAVGEPIYGGSHHMARILIEASRFNRELRVAANIKYDAKLADYISSHYDSITCGPHKEEGFWFEISECLGSLRRQTRFILDLGGKGLESVIYILATSLDETRILLEKLARRAGGK